MEKILSNYIKYKFIFDNDIKHSSYLYQKVFRSIYGYTQNVTKSNKKIYQYHRKGIIDNIPHIRPGKNSIVLPINTEHKLIIFFNTGKSTTHNFREKGNYSIDYSINKIEINESNIINCLENYISNQYIISIDGSNKKLIDEIEMIINDSTHLDKYKKPNKNNLLNKLNNIILNNWFIRCKDKSDFLINIYNKINIVKNKINNIDIETNIDNQNNETNTD